MTTKDNVSWTRKLAASATLLALLAAASPALAFECTFDFPHDDEECDGPGSLFARSSHSLRQVGGILGFFLDVNLIGGTTAHTFGVDANGTLLDQCRTTASDIQVGPNVAFASCEELYGEGEGFASTARFYQHPVDMAFTVVIVN